MAFLYRKLTKKSDEKNESLGLLNEQLDSEEDSLEGAFGQIEGDASLHDEKSVKKSAKKQEAVQQHKEFSKLQDEEEIVDKRTTDATSASGDKIDLPIDSSEKYNRLKDCGKLEPGDVLVKKVWTTKHAVEEVIVKGQKLFHRGVALGNSASEHAALVIGGGDHGTAKVMEATGPGIASYSLDDGSKDGDERVMTTYIVYRCTDSALIKEVLDLAAQVDKRMSNKLANPTTSNDAKSPLLLSEGQYKYNYTGVAKSGLNQTGLIKSDKAEQIHKATLEQIQKLADWFEGKIPSISAFCTEFVCLMYEAASYSHSGGPLLGVAPVAMAPKQYENALNKAQGHFKLVGRFGPRV